jgi:hypothetical protein
LAAAGELERAVKLRLSPFKSADRLEVPELRSVSDVELDAGEAGLIYAMAVWAEGANRSKLFESLPNRFRPEVVADAGAPEKTAFEMMSYVHNMLKSYGSNWERLRTEPVVAAETPVWYQAALAGLVEPYRDTSVWLDYVTGRGRLVPTIANWRRAEVARWRQATDDARAWQDRVFVEPSLRDSARDLLLMALVEDDGRPTFLGGQ